MKLFLLFQIIILLSLKVYSANSDVLTQKFFALFENDEKKSIPNPNGSVVHLNNNDFAKKTSEEMWFVMFHAPWCGHCKQLAPTWDSVAYKLKGKVNIGKVDCTSNGKICQKMDVQGYPTLKIVQGDESMEYRGSRSLGEIYNFALSYSTISINAIEKDDLKRIMNKEENVFLYYYNSENPNIQDMKHYVNLAKSNRDCGSKFTVTSDPEVLSVLEMENEDTTKPMLLLLQDFNSKKIVYSGSLSSYKELSKWVSKMKYPLVTDLSSQNSEDLINNDRIVVIGISKESGARPLKNKLTEASRKWRNNSLYDQKEVVFVWLNGEKWSRYVEKVYNLKEKDFPRIIFTNPETEQFYDMGKNGKLIHEEDINETLESVVDGTIQPKFINGAITRAMKKLNKKLNAFGETISNHPIISAVVIIASFAFFVWFSIRMVPTDIETYEKVPEKNQ